MQKNGWLLCFLLLTGFPVIGQTMDAKISVLEQHFLSHSNEYSSYENLSFLVSQHYLELTNTQRMQIRKFLADHSRFSAIKLNPPGEAGMPVTIRGTVYNKAGTPLKNIQLLVFHTDSKGYYAPDDPVKKTMNEPDARLFGYISTDDHGRYSFTTIHPGTYPNKYNGRYIPQHIHIEIKQAGYAAFSIQMAFEDDPSMKDAYWKSWAEKAGFPILGFTKENGILVGRYDIRLDKK